MTKKQAQKILIARIESLCKEQEISYYTLSYKSTIPLTTLLHIIDGSTRNPGVFTIIKICEGFGMTMCEFFDMPEFDDEIGDYEE